MRAAYTIIGCLLACAVGCHGRPKETPPARAVPTPVHEVASRPAVATPASRPASLPASRPAAPPPLPVDRAGQGVKLVKTHWNQRLRALADRRQLTRGLNRASYKLLKGSMAVLARVWPGVGQPAFQYFSLRDTGFVYSPGRFFAASTVKLTASIGALLTLRKHGLTGAARLNLHDRQGHFNFFLFGLPCQDLEIGHVDRLRDVRVPVVQQLVHRFIRAYSSRLITHAAIQ